MNEEWLSHTASLLVRIVEAAGALIIFTGATVSFLGFVWSGLRRQVQGFKQLRIILGRFLVLGLEFQLAADLIRTSVAPTFEEIGKLAAIAAVRTALNYFLALEIKSEQLELETGPSRSVRNTHPEAVSHRAYAGTSKTINESPSTS